MPEIRSKPKPRRRLDGLELAVYCATCDTLIGVYVRRGPLVCLKIGQLVLREAHGWCETCDQEYHWVASRKSELLTNLVKRLG